MEISVGEKVIELRDLRPAEVSAIITELMRDLKFDKELATSKLLEICKTNDVEITREDVYYVSEYLSEIMDSSLYPVQEDIDDDVVVYAVMTPEPHTVILRKPDWTTIKELRQALRENDTLDGYAFVCGQIIKNSVEQVNSADGVLYTSPKLLTDKLIQTSIALYYLPLIQTKHVVIKKK